MPSGAVPARYYARYDTGVPPEPLEAATLEGAVAEARETASEAATEDACRFGLTSGQRWEVYTVHDGAHRLKAIGIVHADPEWVARMAPRAEAEADGVDAGACLPLPAS